MLNPNPDIRPDIHGVVEQVATLRVTPWQRDEHTQSPGKRVAALGSPQHHSVSVHRGHRGRSATLGVGSAMFENLQVPFPQASRENMHISARNKHSGTFDSSDLTPEKKESERARSDYQHGEVQQRERAGSNHQIGLYVGDMVVEKPFSEDALGLHEKRICDITREIDKIRGQEVTGTLYTHT